jgi:hypothetical protein
VRAKENGERKTEASAAENVEAKPKSKREKKKSKGT